MSIHVESPQRSLGVLLSLLTLTLVGCEGPSPSEQAGASRQRLSVGSPVGDATILVPMASSSSGMSSGSAGLGGAGGYGGGVWASSSTGVAGSGGSGGVWASSSTGVAGSGGSGGVWASSSTGVAGVGGSGGFGVSSSTGVTGSGGSGGFGVSSSTGVTGSGGSGGFGVSSSTGVTGSGGSGGFGASSSSGGGGGGGGCISSSTQAVQPQSFSPANIPEILLASPASVTTSLLAAHGSLNFRVDMPTSSSSPYVLGSDFSGNAQICTMFDASTGQYYDEISLDMSWAADSGGAYNVYYSYTPYTTGVGAALSSTTVQSVYVVDGGPTKEGNVNDCLTGASEEHNPYARDLTLAPQMYLDNNDWAASCQRGRYAPWTAVNSVNDVVNAINAAFTANGNNRISLVLISHGNVDWWRGWPGAFGGAGGLSGNNANVQALGGSIGKVRRVYFESCCTGKGKTNGLNPNVLDSVSDALTNWGQVWATVCGWNHTGFAWFRQGFHVGHTKGDTLTCAH